MTFTDLIAETYAAITVNKVRSGLTMLGIVIGIASVITLTAIGTGSQNSIQARIQSIGSNLIEVMPGFNRGAGNVINTGRGSATSLTFADSEAIAQNISGIAAVAPEISRRYQVTAPGKNTNTQIVGTVPEYLTVRNLKIELGSFITPQNVQSAAKVAVLGPTARDDLFGANAANVIGQTIRINSISFKIIGVTQAKGGTGFGNADDMIFIPLSAARQYLTGGDSVSAIHVQAQSQEVMKQVQNDITTLLLNRHNIIDPAQADFSTLNQEDIVAAASSVANTFTILLAAIASISLLVGGIGIMNMMLTSVTERTREIGLRKAIGAHSFDISLQFLTEAITLTFLGGLVGIALGFLAAVVSTQLFNLPAQVSFSSVLLAFGVSAVIGITFGYYPARRAAKLNPIEALRYE